MLAALPRRTVLSDPGVQPVAHLYVKSKVPWFDIADNLSQYPEIVDLRELV